MSDPVTPSAATSFGLIEPLFDTLEHVHQRSASLRCLSRHRHAFYAAEQGNFAESIAELRQMACGRDDILAEAAGIEAGPWYASPSTHVGYELIAAGVLILAGGGQGVPLDYEE